MKQWIRDGSSPPRARITGAIYLLYFLTATLGQLLGNRGLVVYSNAINIISIVCYLVVTLLLYALFEPVSRGLSLLAALFSLAGCIVTPLSVFHLASSAVSPLLFFGPFCLLIGYLILRSSFLPRVLGVLMALAGLGWLAFLFPVVAHRFSTAIEALGIVAEAALMLWLLVMDVNVQCWKETGH